MEHERMLTTQQVAELLGVEAQTIQRWLRAGRLKGLALGGRAGWRVPESEVQRLLRGAERQS